MDNIDFNFKPNHIIVINISSMLNSIHKIKNNKKKYTNLFLPFLEQKYKTYYQYIIDNIFYRLC